MQTEKSGTLGTGNDQTIFCLQGNCIDRADTAGCNGKGWKADESYTLNTIDRPAVCAEVACMNPWDAQSARVYDQDGVWHSLNANENGGMARDSVLCAGFKLGNSEQARSIGYQEELSPTLNAECGGITRLRTLAEADKDGRLVVLPCKPDGSMLNTSDPERPEIMKRIHFAVAYVCGGIVFHQPYNIFLENIAAGYIRPLNEADIRALEAMKNE